MKVILEIAGWTKTVYITASIEDLKAGRAVQCLAPYQNKPRYQDIETGVKANKESVNLWKFYYTGKMRYGLDLLKYEQEL